MRSPFRQTCQLPLVCALAVCTLGAWAQEGKRDLADDEIRLRLVQASIAAYSGACPCPESRNRSGARCGKNSAYSKPGGSQPLCYPSDVSDTMVKQYREKLPKR